MKNKTKSSKTDKKPFCGFKQSWIFMIVLFAFFAITYATFWHLFHSDLREKEYSFLNIIITADGLITTSTFAFVAFTSGSPSSSGSSTGLNRIYWKSVRITKENWLLIPFLVDLVVYLFLTVLTTMLNILFLYCGYYELLAIGTAWSCLILLALMYRYKIYIDSPHEIAAKILVEQLRYSRWYYKKHKRVIRNHMNLIRNSTNRDYIRTIISTKYFISLLRDRLYADETANFLEKPETSENWGYAAANKIIEVISDNDNLTIDVKIKLFMTIIIKSEIFETKEDFENELSEIISMGILRKTYDEFSRKQKNENSMNEKLDKFKQELRRTWDLFSIQNAQANVNGL